MQGGNRKIWLLAATVAVLAVGGFAYLAQDRDDGEKTWFSDSASVALIDRALSAPPEEEANADADGDGATMAENGGRPRWVSTRERVQRHEALPCTGPRDPINFEVYSAGPAVAGVPMTAAIRRCDAGALADEATSNYLAYLYGDCQAQADSSCLPPLQIRSYPACQRSYAEYSFEGKPLPYTELPPIDGAKVYEIEFMVDHRIEVYTGTSTIVISAADWALAEEALDLLRGQPTGEPPATTASSLDQEPQGSLEPPVNEAIEGELPCHV